jgi:ferric-dicitrate binding protein FerR (iron transport regulator)
MPKPTMDRLCQAAPKVAPDPSLERLAQLARDAGSREVPEAWRARALAEIERAGSRRAASPSSLGLRALALVAASALVALAITGTFLLWPEAPLAYVVTMRGDPGTMGGGSPVDEGPSAPSYVRAGPEGAVARFGDGTVIGFAPGARGRVVAVTAHGARVSIDEGKAHFQVVHLPRAEWTVEAGPFTIAVTGTELDVIWQREQLDLVVHAGAASVRGPLTPQGIALHGGQHLSVDVTRGELNITELPAVTGSAAPAATP